MIDECMHKEHQKAMLTILDEFDRVCKLLKIPYVLFAGTLLGAVRHAGFIPWDDDVDVLLFRDDYDRFLLEAPKHLDSSGFYLQKEFSEHWPMFFSKLRLNGTTCLEKFHPKDKRMHQGIYIDIFPCDDAVSTGLGRYIQFMASKVVIAKSLYRRGYETTSWTKKVFMFVCRLLPISPFLWLTKCGRKNGEYVHSFLAGASRYGKNVYLRSCLAEREDALFEGKCYPVPKAYDSLLRQLFGDYMQQPEDSQRETKIHAIYIDTEHSYESFNGYEDLTFAVPTKSIR